MDTDSEKRERLIQSYEKRIGKIPRRYVPKTLSMIDLMKQLRNLEQTRKTEMGVKRPQLKSAKPRRSKWTILAEKRFGVGNTSKEDISKALGRNLKEQREFKKAFDIIYDRGYKAYATSGSRPNVSPEQWAYGRVFRNLFAPIPQDKAILEKYGVPIVKVKEEAVSGAGSGVDTSAKNILMRRKYPDNFDNDTVAVIKAISFDDTNVKISGSVSYKSHLYWSDYDLFEVVKASSVAEIARGFKTIIRRLKSMSNIYIGDIKCGEVSEWKVIDELSYVKDDKAYGYDKADAMKRLNTLKSDGVISSAERLKAQRLLKEEPSVLELEEIKKDVRFHILRWKPSDVLRGFLKYRGKRISLTEAIKTPGLFKLDVVAFIDGVYVDFSIIYDCRVDGERVNDFRVNPRLSLEMDIEAYSAKGEWFKVAKRMFSLANMRYEDKKAGDDMIHKLIKILNSDLGLLYQVISRINTIVGLTDGMRKPSLKRLKDEVDNFKTALGSVYSSNAYLKAEDGIITRIENILSMDNVDTMTEALIRLRVKLEDILSQETKKQLVNEKLIS